MRNLSEKKRRHQLNTFFDELKDVVAAKNKKTDKTTVLKTAINLLKSYKENVLRSTECELDEDIKPSFITNEEYAFFTLQSIEAYLIVFSPCGEILYTSENFAIVLGYLLDDVMNTNIYDMISQEDRTHLKNLFSVAITHNHHKESKTNLLHFSCKFIRKSTSHGLCEYEPAELIGNIRIREISPSTKDEKQGSNESLVFVGVVRLARPHLYPEITLHDQVKTEFVSHHNFEWKFLFLDESAASIIGYSPLEVLGTSGYNYCHVDDLEIMAAHHRTLMTQDEGVSGYYRFLIKGQKWIWLQTTSYANRRQQWNSRDEFIICTHKVVNPLMPKTETPAEMHGSNRHCSLLSSRSVCSMTSGSASNKTCPSSLNSSSTSENNYYEDDDMLQQKWAGYYTDDNTTNSTSSSTAISSRECFDKEQDRIGKLYEQHQSTSFMDYATTSDSSNCYCPQDGSNFVNTLSEISVPSNDEIGT